jgi:type IV secretion system protein VirB9
MLKIKVIKTGVIASGAKQPRNGSLFYWVASSLTFLAMTVMLTALITTPAFAIRESRPTAIDSRIRVMVYHPDDVFKYIGYYGYQASIELAKDEEVVSISMGDTTSWQIVPAGFRIFIKPMERDATTNMTLITNKRTYFFELYAEEAQDIRDPDMVFNVKFIYPDEEEEDTLKNFVSAGTGPDLTHPEKYNFNYSISGFEEIAPIKIFDDGEFTYLQFRDKNAEMPAIFAVDEDLRESMVNSRLSPNNANMIIVEQVFPKFSIRLGKKVTCVFNEAFRKD